MILKKPNNKKQFKKKNLIIKEKTMTIIGLRKIPIIEKFQAVIFL